MDVFVWCFAMFNSDLAVQVNDFCLRVSEKEADYRGVVANTQVKRNQAFEFRIFAKL